MLLFHASHPHVSSKDQSAVGCGLYGEDHVVKHVELADIRLPLADSRLEEPFPQILKQKHRQQQRGGVAHTTTEDY